MPFEVIITRDFDHMSEVAAQRAQDVISRTLARRDRFVLGLATGNSPTGMYKFLAKAVNAGHFDPAKITSFNLDEYVGLPGENAQARALHPESYSYFMIQELFGLMARKFAETNVPWGCLVDLERLLSELAEHPADWSAAGTDKGKAILIEPQAGSDYLRWVRQEILDGYAAKIAAAGGIDLHVIGVGGRGHVAFHECGIPVVGNPMLLVRLDDNTVSNAVTDEHFTGEEESPAYAISMGVELVYQARTVILLANGRRKAEPIAASLAEDPTEAVPISFGQVYAAGGGDMVYVVDRDAAAGVFERRAEIEARGITITDLSDRWASCRVVDLGFSRQVTSGAMA